MHNFIELAKEEVPQLENVLKKIDAFLNDAPEGCLKWQNKKGKTYFYHQFMKENKWVRRYIKKGELSLAKMLAQKHYYISIRPILEKMIDEIKRFTKRCPSNELEEIYENLRYETEQGDVVRSKSEVIIANILYHNRKDILYKYERPLEIMENGRKKTIYPDFTILNKHTGEIIYWEHAGRMDDTYYANEFVRKMNTYIANDLLPGRDVVVSFESLSNPLDIKVVKRLVKQIINSR